MNQIFLISGMTCLSCKASVENTLNNFKDINEALIDFEKKELVVNSKKLITVSTFQKILPAKYMISVKDIKENSKSEEFLELDKKTKIQQLNHYC